MSNNKHVRIFNVVLLAVLLGLSAIALQPRLSDIFLAYDYVTDQILKDISSVSSGAGGSRDTWEEITDSELKRRLLSPDTKTRLDAIDRISEKKDPSFIPLLVKLFGDSSVTEPSSPDSNLKVSDAARRTVVKLFRHVISEDPQNIKNLIPLLDALTKGSQPEVLGALDVLSSIKEPLGLKIIENLSRNSTGTEISRASTGALQAMRMGSGSSGYFKKLYGTQSNLVHVLLAVVFMLLIFLLLMVFRRKDFRMAVLGLLAIAINFGLVFLVTAEMERTRDFSSESIRQAVSSGDVMAIRSMLYAENQQYPADSAVCQEMARMCDPKLFEILNKLALVEPDDLQGYRRLLDTGAKWIASRSVMLNLNQECLLDIVVNTDESGCKTILKAIDASKVTNNRIVGLVEAWSGNDSADCAREAKRLLGDLKNRQRWD